MFKRKKPTQNNFSNAYINPHQPNGYETAVSGLGGQPAQYRISNQYGTGCSRNPYGSGYPSNPYGTAAYSSNLYGSSYNSNLYGTGYGTNTDPYMSGQPYGPSNTGFNSMRLEDQIAILRRLDKNNDGR
jgi:hypothetical protein